MERGDHITLGRNTGLKFNYHIAGKTQILDRCLVIHDTEGTFDQDRTGHLADKTLLLALNGDLSLSGNHVEITIEDEENGAVTVHDVGSRFGTGVLLQPGSAY